MNDDSLLEEKDFMAQTTPEELLYEQLLGAYHSTPSSNDSYSSTRDSNHWMALNSVIAELVNLGHTNYQKFTLNPANGHNGQYVTIASLRMQMMAALRTMAREFGCVDPGYVLSQYGATSSLSVQQTSNPISNANAHQSQTQHQESSLTLAQHLERIDKLVKEDLTDDQISQIFPDLEKFKENPAAWQNAQRLIIKAANFSRDVAVQFIGSVLAAMAMSKIGPV